jgi:hypothetical protein
VQKEKLRIIPIVFKMTSFEYLICQEGLGESNILL